MAEPIHELIEPKRALSWRGHLNCGIARIQ
jgi:hypothetical protein